MLLPPHQFGSPLRDLLHILGVEDYYRSPLQKAFDDLGQTLLKAGEMCTMCGRPPESEECANCDARSQLKVIVNENIERFNREKGIHERAIFPKKEIRQDG